GSIETASYQLTIAPESGNMGRNTQYTSDNPEKGDTSKMTHIDNTDRDTYETAKKIHQMTTPIYNEIHTRRPNYSLAPISDSSNERRHYSDTYKAVKYTKQRRNTQ
ncbi:14128_t:CDS:2, partial [Gigaspora rosea]